MNENQLDAKQRLVRFTVLLLCTATLMMICLRVIGQGYFPSDDALRHVAKVVSGKDWHDILVMRDEIKMDSHPGWHAVLGAFYRATGASSTGLLNFSVIILFLAFVIPPAFFFPRSEAWILSLVVSALFSMVPIHRLLYGRPFILSMVLVVLFCFLWIRIRDKKKPYAELCVFTLVTALSTWIHGTWFLLALPLAALFLARQWRVFALLTICTIVGIVLGALFTKQPYVLLHQMVFQAIDAFGKHDFQRQLVSEFQPFDGSPPVILVVAGLLLWRKARGDWNRDSIDNPVFILGIIGWVLGFVAVRFWTDWGWPAFAFWVGTEFHGVLGKYLNPFGLKRLALTTVACLVLFLAITNDRGSRWSAKAEGKWPDMHNAEHKPWFPAEGGIIYSDNMSVFYQFFFNNPHGLWRYVLGFEPIWMCEDDLKIFRQIQLTRGKDESYVPWVKKMTERDRMVLVRGKKPAIKDLEWSEVIEGVWSGKLDRKKEVLSTPYLPHGSGYLDESETVPRPRS